MTIMYNTLKRPDQTMIADAKVEITLVAGAGHAPGFVSGSDETILSVYSTLTDANGRWEVDLVPNSDITPDNTYYRVVERVDPNNRSTTYYIVVPDAVVQAQWVGDHRINEPEGIDQIIYEVTSLGTSNHGDLVGLGDNDHPQYALADRLGYLHDQAVPEAVWTIVHSLGYYPNYWAEDSAGNQIEGAPAQVDLTTMTITFSAATTGKAYLS